MTRRIALLCVLLQVVSVPVLRADASVGAGVDVAVDVAGTPSSTWTPWMTADLSLSGFPTWSLSWFADAAVQGLAPINGSNLSATGLIIAGASLRSGLTTVRMDVQNLLDLPIGGAAPFFELAPLLSITTGSRHYSVFGEFSGSLAFEGGSGMISESIGAKIGSSVSVLKRLAPALAFSWRADSTLDASYTHQVAGTLEIPCYPAAPATITVAATELRSMGGPEIESAGGIRYRPEAYWEWSCDLIGGVALSRRVSLDVEMVGAYRLADHGALVDGEPTTQPEKTTSLYPVGRVSVSIINGMSARLELGGDFRISNTQALERSVLFATVESRYSF